MKKFFRKFAVLLLAFVLGVAGTAFLMNSRSTDDRSDMNNPVLPEVMTEFGEMVRICSPSGSSCTESATGAGTDGRTQADGREKCTS